MASSLFVMVDWERVERLRTKGLDWDEIASDSKVKYQPPDGVQDSGRALKTLYYSRKSTRGQSARKKSETSKTTPKDAAKGFLIPGGLTLAVIGLVWAPISYYSSWVGVLTPATYVILVAIAGLVLLAVGTVLGTGRISENWKKPLAVGLVLGLVISGATALTGAGLGVPNLSRNTVGEPGGWQGESPRNTLWTENGQPVIFYLGSIACPYCSASSWAIQAALSNVGTLSGTQYGTSNPADVYPNTPEVEFVSASLASNYVAVDFKEGNDDSSTAVLPSLSLLEQAYVSTYNGGGSIPFLIIGGVYFHVGTFVNPQILAGLSPNQVANIMANPSTNQNVYNTIHQQQLYIEAYIVKVDTLAGITPPTFGSDETNVQDIVSAIS